MLDIENINENKFCCQFGGLALGCKKRKNFLTNLWFLCLYVCICACIVICSCFAGDICPGIHLGNLDGKINAESIFWTVESSRI
jgi:hypothetical protein